MLTISHLIAASGRNYPVVSSLQLRQPVYSDRAFVVTDLPDPLVSATYIQTANDDKKNRDPNFLSFEVDQPVIVYIGYDRRNADRPVWLSRFVETNDDLVTTDTRLQLFVKILEAGTITLGGNQAEGNSMYVVVVTAAVPEPEPLHTLTMTYAIKVGEHVHRFAGELTEVRE